MNNRNIIEKSYQTELTEYLHQLIKIEKKLHSLEGQIRILEAENDFLLMQNIEYERKLSLITNNPINKAGIKLYHICHKLWHKR